MRIKCPNCATHYQISEAALPPDGAYGRCVKCQYRFFVHPRKTGLKTSSPNEVICSQCGKRTERMDASLTADRRILCQSCREAQYTVRERKPYENLRKWSAHPPVREGGALSKFIYPFCSLFSNDLAVDLGTANTLIYQKKAGIVLNESSVVAIQTDPYNGKKVLAVGYDAKQMMGKTPAHIIAVRPLKDGVIADFEMTGAMLREFIRKVRRKVFFFRPRVIIAVPSGITSVEKRAVIESARQAGAREVFLVEEPMAAAVGADMPIDEPTCNMVVDIGGGTTEIAVISLAGIVSGTSVKVAGDKMDEAIMRYVRKQYNFVIGERTAEAVKIHIGNACPDADAPESIEIKGWEVISGCPKVFSFDALELREAIADPLKDIVEAIKMVLDKTPQELASSALDNGIVLTGGVALLKNMDKYISEKTGLPVRLAEDPLTTIVKGTGKVLDNLKIFRKVTA